MAFLLKTIENNTFSLVQPSQFRLKCQLALKKLKSVQTFSKGDDSKILKIHWHLLETSYSLKPMDYFQPNSASSIFG